MFEAFLKIASGSRSVYQIYSNSIPIWVKNQWINYDLCNIGVANADAL